MKSFSRHQGEMHCEAVPLRRLAVRYGTPLYVYSRRHIVGQYRSLDRAFASLSHLVCYAVKANNNLAILRTLAEDGAGFDIVSAGELYRVIQAGADPKRCVFAGVGKTNQEIEYALKSGIYCFNVESESEMELIDAVARRLRKRAPVALRVNPGVDPDTHHYISTGKHDSKFGISIRHALEVYRNAHQRRGIEIRGVQMHLGSQIIKTAPYRLAIQKMTPLVQRVRALASDSFQFFDMGGGLGIQYRKERPPTAEQFAQALLPSLRKLDCRILMEPGRFLVGNSGILLTRVLYVKQTPSKTFVITDAAMTDLIRPMAYGSYHAIQTVGAPRRQQIVADVVGPVCESGDFLALDRRVPVVRAGELLAIMGAGAYGMSMASNYNSRSRPAEVLVSGGRHRLVRRRETLEDQVRSEG